MSRASSDILPALHWHVDNSYDTLPEVVRHKREGQRPARYILRELQKKYEASVEQGLRMSQESQSALNKLGVLTAE